MSRIGWRFLWNIDVGPYIFIGSEPNRLAISDDGKYLYVGLDGVAGIRRLNLVTRVPVP